MDSHLLLRNRSVRRVVVGVPEGHRHIRARIETAAGDVITLQEATLAALCRAFLGVTTHPTRQAIELVSQEVEDGKEGFAPHQLVERDKAEEVLRHELAAALKNSDRGDKPGIGRADDTSSTEVFARDEAWKDTSSVKKEALAEAMSLELDESQGADDGPVFGATPTVHSWPRDELAHLAAASESDPVESD